MEAGTQEEVGSWSAGLGPGGVPQASDFAASGTRLYVQPRARNTPLRVVEFDAEGVAGPTFEELPHTVADIVRALAVDACDRIYTVENDSVLRCMDPDGSQLELATLSDDRALVDMVWGTGQGGWAEDALYVVAGQPFPSMVEVVVGTPGRFWSGELRNVPSP